MEPRTFETPGGLRFEVDVPAGLIEVEAAETTQTRLEIEGERDPGDIIVRFDPVPSGGNRLRVEYHGRKFGWLGGRQLHVAARVPTGTDVDASSGSADLVTRGRLGSIAFRSGSGELSFDEVDGDLTMKVASGDASGGRVGGSFTMSGASGDVELTDVGGDLTVRTASGDLKVDAVGGTVTVNTVSGEVEIGSVASGSTTVRSVSGDVEIGVARGTRVYLDLSTVSGDAASSLDASESAGAEGTDLELHVGTVSGDITVQRAPTQDAKAR